MRLSSKIQLAGGIALVVVFAGIGIVVTQHYNQKVAITRQDAGIASNFGAFKDSLVSKDSLSTTPQNDRQAFIAAKATELGLSPQQLKTATPDSLTGACMQEQATRLSSIMNAQPDAIERNKANFTTAVKAYQDYCYETFSEAGKMTAADMPKSMKH